MFSSVKPETEKKDAFYFVPREPGVTSSVVEKGEDGGEIESKPADTAEEVFEPKPVNRNIVCIEAVCTRNLSHFRVIVCGCTRGIPIFSTYFWAFNNIV
jgi:hypothetical protein